jgi:ABC-type multidrug transport system ATPase subunit
LLDEPTAALDPEAANVILELVVALAKSGTAVLAVTHSAEHAARLDGTRYRMTAGVLSAAEASS